MIKVEIKNKATQIITHSTRFDTQELANAWIASQKSKGEKCAWGRPTWTEKIEIGKDKNGEPTYNYKNHADEFTIIQTDISQQVALEETKKQSCEQFSALLSDSAIDNKSNDQDVKEVVRRLLGYWKACR